MKEYQFYAINRKNFIRWIVYFGGVVVFGFIPIVMGIIHDNYNVSIFGFLFLVVFTYSLINRDLAKITINSNGIEYRTYFKRAFIAWKNIKSIGAFRAPMNRGANVREIDPKYAIDFNDYMYVSTHEKYLVYNDQIISDEFISFEWRDEVFNDINIHLNAIRK